LRLAAKSLQLTSAVTTQDLLPITKSFFLRPKLPEVKARIEGLIACTLKRMLARERFDAVHDLAIPSFTP